MALCYNILMESLPLPPPRGITIEQAAKTLHYSKETIRRMIVSKELVAWRPRANGRRWLIDEVCLAHYQNKAIQQARKEVARVDAQMRLNLSDA